MLVITLRDVYEDKETLYAVLELCGSFSAVSLRYFAVISLLRCGGDLLEQITQQQFFKEDDGREIMRSLVEALAFLHSKSIVHADLRVRRRPFRRILITALLIVSN